MPRSQQIFLVDDEAPPRRAFAALIQLDGRYSVCGEAESAEQALQRLSDADPTIVLTDLKMVGPDGIQLTKAIRTETPTVRTLVLSSHDESLFAERAILAGASGYVMKGDAALQLFDALDTVAHGGIHLSRPMWRALYREPSGSLSKPEHRRLLQIIGLGNPPLHEVADAMGMGETATRALLFEVMEALNLHSETQVRLFAAQERATDAQPQRSSA